ncbi:MAG TPA: amidohydrolase family protein [Thermoanaerobaculia bacterium]|nr:amidohydrolase family protein [Thermoanaerobaculia bacterium]
MKNLLLPVAGMVVFAGALSAQPAPMAFTGAKIIPISGAEIENGTLIVRDGRIAAVGPAASVSIPANATRIDVSGRVLMPGLVDSHSHIGEAAGADSSNPIQPEVRVMDAINVRDAGLQKAQAGGITTVNIMPGSGHLLSGQTIYLKLRDGGTIDDLIIPLPDGSVAGGIKMANGTNPRKASPFPGTRAKAAALIREQLVKAQEYRDKMRRTDVSKRPDRDLGMEALADVLDGKRVVHHHTHRHDDILTVLRLAKEFGFRVVLQHVSEGWRVADEIAAAGVPASIIMIDSPGGKIETQHLSYTTGKVLDEAGVLVGFHTDDGITDSRLFLRSAGLAVRAGMSRKSALEAMTINNAKMLELDARIGSLEPGKDADFILLSGDPLSVYTHVLETWVEGRKVFDRSNPKDRLYAVGGYGAGRDQVMHLDCMGEGDAR